MAPTPASDFWKVRKNFVGDWTNLLSVMSKSVQSDFYCRFKPLVTAQGFLTVWGMTLDLCRAKAFNLTAAKAESKGLEHMECLRNKRHKNTKCLGVKWKKTHIDSNMRISQTWPHKVPRPPTHPGRRRTHLFTEWKFAVSSETFWSKAHFENVKIVAIRSLEQKFGAKKNVISH